MSHDNSASNNKPGAGPDDLAGTESELSQEEHKEEKLTPDANALMFSMSMATINELAEQLRERKQKLQMIEEAQARGRTLMAIVDANTSDRLSRAQTTYERRMYRALACLMALRGEAPGKALPVPKTE